MSGQLVLALSASEARVLTDEVKARAHELWFKLRQLHDGGAHTALGYRSWGDYCAAEFDMGSSRAYQLLDAGRVAAAVNGHSTTVEPPANEAQARELAPVLRDEGEAAVVEVWRELRDEYGEDLTAKRVKQVVKNRLAREERDRTAAEEREAKRRRGEELASRWREAPHDASWMLWPPGTVIAWREPPEDESERDAKWERLFDIARRQEEDARRDVELAEQRAREASRRRHDVARARRDDWSSTWRRVDGADDVPLCTHHLAGHGFVHSFERTVDADGREVIVYWPCGPRPDNASEADA